MSTEPTDETLLLRDWTLSWMDF